MENFMTKIKIAWLKLCISILIVYAFSTNFIHIPEPKAADGLAIIIAIIWAVKSIFVIRRESKNRNFRNIANNIYPIFIAKNLFANC